MIASVWRGSRAALRQWRSDLLASFWLRPSAMTIAAVLLAELLIAVESGLPVPDFVSRWAYAGGLEGARGLLGVVAAAAIGVAGTTFSITVAALALASNQMGPRLLRNFTRDPGNQYALGTFLATFAYALTVLRTVRGLEDGDTFVPHLAVSVALLLGFACVAVLMWFLHHVANSINVAKVIGLVHGDLAETLAALPRRDEAHPLPALIAAADALPDGAPIVAPGAGYLRVLDDAQLADWAASQDALIRLRVRPGDYVFPHSLIGEVVPASKAQGAQRAVAAAMRLDPSRSVEQDPEYAVRKLAEIALRALSPSMNDPFTAIAVLDSFGSVLCDLSRREMPDGRTMRDGRLRLARPGTDYDGLVDAMFHMIRQSGAGNAAVMIRLLEVLAEVIMVEGDTRRRAALLRHGELAAALGARRVTDEAAQAGLQDRALRLRRAARADLNPAARDP